MITKRNVVEDDPSVVIPRFGAGDARELNEQTAFNRSLVEHLDKCGCFYCGSTFAGPEIKEWLDEGCNLDETALCPYCGTDAVIAGNDVFPLSTALLSKLYMNWFEDEYEHCKNSATIFPQYSGRDDYLRKGIPFLLQRACDKNILMGELREGWTPDDVRDWLKCHTDDVSLAQAMAMVNNKHSFICNEYLDSEDPDPFPRELIFQWHDLDNEILNEVGLRCYSSSTWKEMDDLEKHFAIEPFMNEHGFVEGGWWVPA